MRLFKRRCSDPSPQLVSLCPIEEPRVISGHDDDGDTSPRDRGTTATTGTRGGAGGAYHHQPPPAASEPASRDQSAERGSPKPQKKGLTTWSKKVSRKWDAMKRSDSSELLLNSYQNSRRQYSVNIGPAQASIPTSQSYPTSANKRISRVESIRNLFVRNSKDKTGTSDIQELKKRFDDIVSRVSNTGTNTSTNTVLRRTPSGNRRRHTGNDEYELNEKQLLEYLLMCQPEGSNRSLDELIKNFKDTVKNTTNSGLSKRLSVLQEENYKKSLRHSAPVDGAKFDVLKLNDGPLTIDQLCAVLNSILAKSDESGYDSDSTRNGSDSPRGSIKSQNSEVVYSSQQDVNEGLRNSTIDWQTADGLLESMCVDTSLNDSETSRNLLEGFNTSIRTLTNVTGVSSTNSNGAAADGGLASSSKIEEESVDGLEGEPEVYVGDTEIEDSSSEGEECRTLTRSVPRNSFNLSRTSRRKQRKSTCVNDTRSNRSSFNNTNPSSTNNIFEENLEQLPSFGKIEPEFVTLGMLNKTSTGLMDSDEFFQNCSKLSSSFEKLTQTFNKHLDDMALKADDGIRDRIERTPEHISVENSTIVRPGVVDEIVSGFENRVKRGGSSNGGSVSGSSGSGGGSIGSSFGGSISGSGFTDRDFKCIRLKVAVHQTTGLIIERDQTRINCVAIAEVEKLSPADLNGNFRIGDEIVKVNGRRLRGLALQEAKEILKSTGDVEIVISRPTPTNQTKNSDDNSTLTRHSNINENTMYYTARTGENTFSNSKISENTAYITAKMNDNTYSNSKTTENTSDSIYTTPKISENSLYFTPNMEHDVYTTPKLLDTSRLSKITEHTSNTLTRTTNRTSKILQNSSSTLCRLSKLTPVVSNLSNTLSRTTKTAAGTFKTIKLADGTTRTTQNFQSFPKSKSFVSDQNWTLSQKVEPKIGLYTPKALSVRARSFIGGDENNWQSGSGNNLNGKCDDMDCEKDESDCVDSSAVTWNHKSPSDDGPFSRKISQQSFQDLSRLDDSKLSNDEVSFRTPLSSSWRDTDNKITVKSHKRFSMLEGLSDVSSRLEELSPVTDETKENGETLQAWKMSQELQLTEALRAGKSILPETPKNPDAPKIVGGTLKPNIKPQDIEIKNDAMSMDRSFEIESPIKKFAASPAKLGINGSIGRRSSPAKLTGMKKFYYGQKRRSLQATIKEQHSSSTSPDGMSTDKPQAEPISARNRGSINSRRSLQSTSSSGSPRDLIQPPAVVSRPAELLRVQFTKGPGQPSLGFTIAGGSDSPRGTMGLYVKTVLPGGQAEIQGTLKTGDEILSVNSQPLSGLTRAEATAVFGSVRAGTVTLRLLRRGSDIGTTNGTTGGTTGQCPRCDVNRHGKRERAAVVY